MKRSFLILLATATASLVGAPQSKPKSATIIDVPSERCDYGVSIGNIKVRFTDGHTEIWTNGGKCLMPHVSPNGHVGWTRYTGRNCYREPVNNILRIRFLNGRLRDFMAYPNGPFIEEWGFADDDSAIVIKSRGRHGPAYYVKYDLATGQLIGSVDRGTDYSDLPKWARPFADDKPDA